METLAVAAQSARMMAEAAAADGYGVVALDCFGDADTRAAAQRWIGIGAAAGLQVGDERLLAALAQLARQGDVCGWVAGSGFEGRPALLARAAAVLPLIGTAPASVAMLRDPPWFFGWLDANDIEHPPVRLGVAADAAGWLSKDLHGSGGWHIRPARPGTGASGPGGYLQRAGPGMSMSATFVAGRDGTRLLGVNRQLVRAVGERPHVFHGVVGPLPVAPAVLRRLQAIVDRLATALPLRGLGSLDFLLDGDRVSVLEVNPRPPASLALYAAWQPMAAHVRACRDGALPAPPPASTAVHGYEIVLAPRPVRIDAAASRRLAAQPGVHDLPGAGQVVAASNPLCSVDASGASAEAVVDRLRARRAALLQTLEIET